MTRERFYRLVQEELETLPPAFASRLVNVAILVEDYPPGQRERRAPRPRRLSAARRRNLLMGIFIGTPATERSVFDAFAEPARIVLYQKNIEAVCRGERELRREIRLTVMHEIGHYFGMSEDQLRDV